MLAQGVFRRFQFLHEVTAGVLERVLPVLRIGSADFKLLRYHSQLLFGRGSGAAGSDLRQGRFQQLAGHHRWRP